MHYMRVPVERTNSKSPLNTVLWSVIYVSPVGK